MDKDQLRESVRHLPPLPGVYRFYDAEGIPIYVGKARNLRNRVGSYVNPATESVKTRAMVASAAQVEVTVTDTEVDALLLESNLIKQHRPRYNIVFRDDKSYPWLYLDEDSEFPRLQFYRGNRRGTGRYFGPYPSAGACRRTLNLLQKLFLLRQCDDSFFRHRQRPCLQYQIRRCSAPCVGLIGREEYARDIALAGMVLEGRNEQALASLEQAMQSASAQLDFEHAARYRDQIALLRRFQESQHIVGIRGEADIIACEVEAGLACVQIFNVRNGLNLGNRTWFQSGAPGDLNPALLVDEFLKQHYLGDTVGDDIPPVLYVSHRPEDADILMEVLSMRAGRSVVIRGSGRGERSRWIRMAMENARLALRQRAGRNQQYADRLDALREFLERDESINRTECFDISHTSGDETVGACVVYGPDGAQKSAWRRFGIKDIIPGDDYSAMAQVIGRHLAKARESENGLPDVLLIDGGKGQVGAVLGVLRELQLEMQVNVLGIAKGPSRKPGLETLVLSDGKRTVRLQEDAPMLHLLQEIRDEAHRFAITGHRLRRGKKQTRSLLDDIEGIGQKRRQRLITHFGGMQGVSRAGIDDLVKVPGISPQLARRIYETLHGL